jgi:hypothetical protein
MNVFEYKDPIIQREYQREWIAQRRTAYFLGKSCVNCGSTKQLELDHIDPKLKVDHRIWSWSVKRIAEEVKKCQILCVECHRKKTKQQNYVIKCKNGHSFDEKNTYVYSNGRRKCRRCRADIEAKRREKIKENLLGR